MPAAKIMLIRHAEKPNGEAGVMPDGTENPEALTATGWKRANALVGLFDPANGAGPRPPLAKPASLFASGSRKPAAEADDHAARSSAQTPHRDFS